jgi:hypothetical protein
MTAAINPLNYIKGPANVWVGVFGVTEPAQTNAALIADPGAGWRFIGATQGGVTWDDTDTVSDTTADQVIDPIGGRITARKVTLTFNMLEATLANLALALNNYGSVTTPGSGISVFDPGQPTAGSIPAYSAYLIDGWAPQLAGGGAARRRGIFRKVLNQPKVTDASDPTKDTVLAVSASCYFVSGSISPYITMDQTA